MLLDEIIAFYGICGFAYRYLWRIFFSLPIFEGAGITSKIAYMIEKENIDPSYILALTFSREAERNMREKANNLESKALFIQK